MLRAMGRAEGGAPDSEEKEFSFHLDADELSAFAEGLLPVSARTRLTAHLADCFDCRHLVTQLSLAAGPKATLSDRPKTHKEQISFWQGFASLFSSPAVRYATPILVLLVAAAASVIIFRTEQTSRPELVAQAPSTRMDEGPPAGFLSPGDVVTESQSKEESTRDDSSRRPAKEQAKTAERESGESSGVRKDSQSAPTPSATEGQSTFAPDVVAERGPSRAAKEKKDLSKQEEQPTETDQVARNRADREESTREKDEPAKEATARPADSAMAPGVQSLGSVEARRSRSETRKAATEEQERIVAGFRLRKQGNLWLDVTYKASLPMVTVRRNSEQFRALAADQPRIRRLAAELDGEVIVVLQGKAYRIRSGS